MSSDGSSVSPTTLLMMERQLADGYAVISFLEHQLEEKRTVQRVLTRELERMTAECRQENLR